MRRKTTQRETAPGAGRCAVGFGSEADFDELASALAALTADDLSGLGDALNSPHASAADDIHGHIGGGFLANQF